jgi:hypothetical protein
MKKGGAGTAILIILLLLIIIILLFPNQVEQFLKQVNIPVGNNTYNLGQLFQQFINGSQNYVSNNYYSNNYYSYENEMEAWVGFPIFSASTYNIGVSNEVTYVGPDGFDYGPESQMTSLIKNVSVYENGNNIDFSINLQDISGCNNINSINIQNATLIIFIESFNPSEVSSYNTYSGNLNYITYDELVQIYEPINKLAKKYYVIIQNNQYGFSCELNSIATISCNIDVNQLELNPAIQNIMNEINFAGNLSIWYGLVYLDATYNCQ